MLLNIPEEQRPLAIFLFPGKYFLNAKKKEEKLYTIYRILNEPP
jgi:hypothetical protein